MTKIYGWSPTEMRRQEDAFADAVDARIAALGRDAVKLLHKARVVVAAGSAGTPAPPVELGELGAITGLWQGFVSVELLPLLSDVYLESAGVIWQGIEEAFDTLTVPEVSDVFAEDYLAAASNRLVGIGDLVWQNVRQELLVGFSLGESTSKLTARVEQAAQVSQARANVIARTEANMAANAGSFQQVLLSGLTGTKEWLDTNDARTRCTHRAAGGQTVDLLHPFTLGGGECGEGLAYLMFPGDPTGPPSEIIQCRCSLAFDLTPDDESESVVTAAAEVHTGAMIALLPSPADAATLELEGFEDADQLHVTLLYLGEAASWSAENRRLVHDVVAGVAETYGLIETETFSVNIFNPTSDDTDTAIVLGVRGNPTKLAALHNIIDLNVSDVFDDGDVLPEQHRPWVPHITLAYTDDLTVVQDAIERLGPITFDRVGVFFGGERGEYSLDGVITAASKQWKESEHLRDTEGKFAKTGVDIDVPDIDFSFDFGENDVTPDLGTAPSGGNSIAAGDFSDLKKISGAKGTNVGGIFEAPDGSHWYIKKQKSAKHAQNEHDASALYRAAGIDVPEVIIGSGTPDLGSGVHTATRIIPEGNVKFSTAVKKPDSKELRAVRRGFAVDVLLANWDVAGLDYDNVIFDEDGKPHRIDVGGALEFRAQGGLKGVAFGTDVPEWDTLRDPSKNPQSAKLFQGLTDEELTAAVEHVERLTPEKIHELVKDKDLADKLVARRENLLKRAEAEGVLSSATGDVDFHPVNDHGVETLSPTEAFEQHMASKMSTSTPPPPELEVLDDEFDLSEFKQSVIWAATLDDLEAPEGTVVLKGTTLDVHNNPLRVVVRKNNQGVLELHEEEFDTPIGKWIKGRVWHNEEEFNDANLEEYDVVKGKPKIPRSMSGMVPGATHANLWKNLDKGLYASGDTVAEGLDLNGKYHHLIVRPDPATGKLVFSDEVLNDDGTDVISLVTWTSLSDFQEHDYAWMGIGSPKAPPGSVKSVTTPVSVPKVVPKQVPKLTNAVIYGKYQNGDVIASRQQGSAKIRLVYQDNKIVQQTYNEGGGNWITSDTWGKAEAYKNLSGTGPWYLGDIHLTSDKPSAPITVTKQTVTTPTPTIHDLQTSVLHGNYADGQVIATYKSNVSSSESRWIWSAANGEYVKQNRTSKAGSWHTITKTKDPGKVVENTVTLPSTVGVWSKGEEPKFGVHVPSTPTVSTVSPTAGMSLTDTIKNGVFKNGDVIATYKKSGSPDEVRLIFSGGKFVKQRRLKGSTDESDWKHVSTYLTADGILSSIAKGSGTWTKVDEPGGGLKTTSTPTLAVLTPAKTKAIKKIFDDNGVKWHSNVHDIIDAAAQALKDHPELTLSQVLTHMDSTTKTQTSPTPFTGKVAKFLSTAAGKAKFKSHGLPTDSMSSGKYTPTISTPKTPVHHGPTVTISEVPTGLKKSPPGSYSIQSVSKMTEIHIEMQAQHGAWTTAQRSALRAYTGSAYQSMNGCLRKPSTCTDDVKKRNADAIAGMRPTTRSFRVTRGAGWSSVGLPSSDVKLTDADRVKKLQDLTGKLLQEPGFLSTSASDTPAFLKKVKFVIDVPVGVPAAWVYAVSTHTSEKELLLAPGLQYRVKKVEPSVSGPSVVYMEVVIP